MPKKRDLTNMKFFRLTAIRDVGKSKDGHRLWECLCDCGATKIESSHYLLSGKAKSCGCWSSERTIMFNKETKTKHGQRYTRLYNIWHGIKRRTSNPTDAGYKNYGGRGIYMCQEWHNDFASFHAWAMSNGYKEDLSIERIDNEGPYTPENCKWVTQKDQANNRRSSRYVEYMGKTLTLSQWATELGIPSARIYKRAQQNLPPEQLLYKGKFPSRKKLTK